MSKEKETDSRRSYILRIAGHVLSLHLVEEKLPNVQALYSFCDTPTAVFCISRTDQRGHIDIANEVKYEKPALMRVVFFKVKPVALTNDNYKTVVNVLTTQENAAETFLGSVQKVFSKLVADPNQKSKGSNQLREIVNELEESLLLSVEQPGKNGTVGGSAEGVLSIEDEIKYWKMRASARKDPSNFSEAFEPLAEKLPRIEDVAMEELIELVEAAEDTVDMLWNADEPYPQTRMKQLFYAFDNTLFEAVCSKLSPDTLWSASESTDQLRTAISIIDQWLFVVTTLTTQTWTRHGLHDWTGEPQRVDFMKGFRARLDEVLSLRTLGDQIVALLRDKSAGTEIQEAITGAMKGFNPVVYSPYTENNWRSRLSTVERTLDPIIDKTIPILKSRFTPSKIDSNLLLSELHRFRHFLSRGNVKAKLLSDRETLLERLLNLLQVKRKEYNERISTSFDASAGRYLTEIASKLIWIRQQKAQVAELATSSKTMLDDLKEYPTLERNIAEFTRDLAASESEQFDEWCREVLQAIDTGSDPIGLETSGRLMVLDKDRGVLRVNYSDRLVRLLREVRQVQSLGYTVPSKIQQCVTTGEQFYRHGILLKQVAHFYNTIEEQMLPCQQAMMIDEALAFEALAIPGDQNSKQVTWDNPQALEAYIGKLQDAAFQLTTHNRRLRKVHAEITLKVLKLMSLDLLKDEDKWSAIIGEIRAKFTEEERHCRNKANMRTWAIHWDAQLYKALAVQFQWGLKSLQSQIPTINAQLIFRDQQIQFRPPIEELKHKYYSELRKFLSIPQKFRGIQNVDAANNNFFVGIVEDNVSRFEGIYENSRILFEQLETVSSQFEEWVVLGQVNIEDTIEEHFRKASDWEDQLKALKAKGREAERLPNEIRVDCVLVSTLGIKSTIDDLLNRLYDTLTWTLRHSVTTDVQTVGQTLTTGIETLGSRPTTLDEVAAANQNHVKLAAEAKTIAETVANLEEKNVLLRSVGGSGVDNVTSLKTQYDKFLTLLESHEGVIKEQLEVMKQNVGDRVKTLKDESERLLARWNQFKPKSEILNGKQDALLEALEFIKEKRQQFDELTEIRNKIASDSEQFGLDAPDIAILDDMEADLKDYENNYLLYEKFTTELTGLSAEEWILFRSKTYVFTEFLSSWTEQLKAVVPATPVTVRLQKDIDGMNEFANCLKYCRGEMLSGDHWLEFFRLVKLPRGTTLEKLTFGNLLSVQQNVVDNVEELKNLNGRAQGEVTIREAIQELEVWAAQAEFSLTEYKHSNGQTIKIIKEWKEAINQVKDNQALLQSLKNSPYYAQFKDQTSIWEKRITDLDVYLHQMNEIQRKWVYLEPIFGRGSLPSEASRFNRVDVEFRIILQEIAKDSRFIALCNRASLGRTLEQTIDQLNRCQRALNEFLEQKRTAFPRFYFLGDDDLLEILGQSTNPTVIQAHLRKLFQGIDKVIFGQNNETIQVMVSAEGEQVRLAKAVRVVPQVEQWLAELTTEMRSSLKKLVTDCLKEDTLDPSKYPSQVLCLAEEIRFCRDVEQILESRGSLAEFKTTLLTQLNTMTATVVEDRVLRLKLKALILDLIHHIGVVDQLINAKDVNKKSWTWQKQLRFYLENGTVIIRMSNAEFAYSFEYQGNVAKLVHTPLTDKCYLTLTQALSMGLGGNPYGPAGTGKTESVKALANLMGRQVLVFNCDEGIDVHSIGRIFVGLIQCGAWGCFDEFNRLDKSVLSAVSTQVQTIQDAIRSKSGTCHLNDKTVPVDGNSAIFVTLNPAGKGYGGRQRLPDNLKQLFRPVVMSAPDNELIAETLLYSEGFKDATILARKLVAAFSLSREMLSAQQHYDWGLRALKTVLRGCGDVISKDRSQSEGKVVVQTLMLNTLSKLTFADSKRFRVLLDDIFPDIDKSLIEFTELGETLKKCAAESSMELTPVQINKIFELYEQLRQRTGVVIVGPPGSGKSTLWQLLKQALASMNQSVDTFILNPKSMTRARLFGHMDLDTREWTDGAITMAARQVVKDASKAAWIICDGDIDPEWIEALNSVLDDNKLLTMPSGERIQFGDNVNFIFETDDLQYASPATISRMGMIFLSSEDLDVREVVKRFLTLRKDEGNSSLSDWIDEKLLPAIDWTMEHQTKELPSSKVAILENVLSLIAEAKSKNAFLVGLMRGLVPHTKLDDRQSLVEQVVFTGVGVPDPRNPLNVYCDRRTDALTSFTDDFGMTVKLEDMQHDNRRPFIMTASAQVAKDTITNWLAPDNRHSFIVVGPDGCGKEQLLRAAFEDDHHSVIVTMHCSAQTTAEHIEQLLAQYCVQVSSATGRVLKPKDRENLVLYLKSPDLVKPDRYGSAMLICFLQQLLAYHGYYDKNLDWIGLEAVQVVISVSNAPGSERFGLPTRFLSLMRAIVLEMPSDDELTGIYTSYLTPILEASTGGSAARVESLAVSMVRTFSSVRQVFRASDQVHYTFSPIDISNWVVSLLRHQISKNNVTEDMNSAVTYEARRIFGDRLINSDHRAKFEQILTEIFAIKSQPMDKVFATNTGPFNPTNSVGKPLQAIGRNDYVQQLEKAVNRFEFEVSNFSHSLYSEFVDLCLVLDRLLTTPGGSVLLAGRGGMGRRAAASLVAHMHQIRIFNLKVSKNYVVKSFANDIKQVMQWAAVDGDQVVLIIEDFQLLNDAFIQYVNSILAAGNVPGLFAPQEFDQFSAALMNGALQDNFSGGTQDYFAYKVKQNLHVALIMDITKPDFKSTLASNPSLYKHCSLVWRDTWMPDTLVQLTEQTVAKHNIEAKPDLTSTFVQLFESAPETVKTPAKFSAFVANFCEIYSKKRSTVKTRLTRLKAGVDKLTETRDAVAKMQKKAAKKSKLLAEKQADADKALAEITQSMTGATDQKADMEQLKVAREEENVRIEKQKVLIDAQLADVEPLLAAARAAVGSIKSEALSEIRSLRAPPEAIRDILQAVLLFMGILDTSWEAMRKFLAKSGVKEEIINFDATRITPDVRKKVKALIDAKPNSFDPAKAKRASVAAAPLTAWIHANLEYSKIVEQIAPLENEKNALIKNLEKAEKQMDQLSKGLKTIDKKVDTLKSNFEVLMKEATQIKIDLDREQATIAVAGTLVDGLSGEFVRWQEQMQSLQIELNSMERCCLVAAAFVTFLGVASESQRVAVLRAWLADAGLPADFSVVRFIATETERLNWKNNGLPASTIAIENTAMMFSTKITPFCIDPTGKVAQFLVKHLSLPKSGVGNVGATELLNGSQADLMTQIELGVRFGKTIVVDDVLDVDPALAALLRRDFASQGPLQVVQLGEKTVDVNESFKLFLCSKNEHIRLPGFVKNSIAEFNYSTTRSGLASQLLSLAISIERPELEVRSSQLTSEAEKMKLQLDELEQILLTELVNSEGSLLKNTQLLDSLHKSKENSDKIAASLAESEKLQKELDEQRNAYAKFAERSAQLYFVISNLHNYNHMYNFNVNTIFKLFQNAFAENTVSSTNNEAARLDAIYRTLQQKVFELVSRALFKDDRLMFALNFIRGTQPNAFEKNEWEFFTGELVSETGASNNSVSSISWIAPDRLSVIANLQMHLPTLFHNLSLADKGTWSEFNQAPDCESRFPSSIDSKLTAFQKVLVVQALRPDRLYSAMTKFAQKALNLESLNPPPLDFHSIWRQESSNREPLIVMTGAGADPSQELTDLADKVLGKGQCAVVAMGQGQQGNAISALKKAMDAGEWVLLGNLHLVVNFVAEIQKIFATSKPHDHFRLWITTEPDDGFPVVFLQESMKMTFEAPPGVRNNLERTYTQWKDGDGLPSGSNSSNFVLAWMHAVLQERRSFIPEAWLKFYEFSNADLRTAKTMLASHAASDYDTIRGLMENAIYGGRIENMLDVGILQAYLAKFFNPQMLGSSGAEVAPGIVVPNLNGPAEYLKYIKERIPANDEPKMFGLPENILFSWEITQSGKTLTQMRTLAVGATATGAQFDRDAWNLTLSPLLATWKRLNQGATLVSMTVPVAQPSDDPIAEVVGLEFTHAITIVKSVHASLTVISKAIRGAIVPDLKTIETALALMIHQTPAAWDLLWPGPSTPIPYLEALIFKAKSIQKLAESGSVTSTTLFSRPFNLYQFLRPSALLNAYRQLAARTKKLSMDSLKFVNTWQASGDINGAPALTLAPLMIQGAQFDGAIRPVSASSAPYSDCMGVTVAWVGVESNEPISASDSVEVPVFGDRERQEFICKARLPCRGSEKLAWTIAGVALFLNSGKVE
uniref:Cytoplasmic dynein 2 heavy chain 1 n=1 Tax=Panagrellus redivivus TaxID=6233 RepID=A0A7E4URM5_PANRE